MLNLIKNSGHGSFSLGPSTLAVSDPENLFFGRIPPSLLRSHWLRGEYQACKLPNRLLGKYLPYFPSEVPAHRAFTQINSDLHAGAGIPIKGSAGLGFTSPITNQASEMPYVRVSVQSIRFSPDGCWLAVGLNAVSSSADITSSHLSSSPAVASFASTTTSPPDRDEDNSPFNRLSPPISSTAHATSLRGQKMADQLQQKMQPKGNSQKHLEENDEHNRRLQGQPTVPVPKAQRDRLDCPVLIYRYPIDSSISSKKPVLYLTGHTRVVYNLAWSLSATLNSRESDCLQVNQRVRTVGLKETKVLASASADGTARIWWLRRLSVGGPEDLVSSDKELEEEEELGSCVRKKQATHEKDENLKTLGLYKFPIF
ncbi:unnamed protein product [Protopolystoma xenopodis]|uniref:Uncharacterized protein n=1 Tax=Protopolystoma xenopodis TaxID=117903 RepID=A0A448XD71_9PLAT|nr:unnamed protein product [Protopolystoma xenopodis]